MRLQRRHRLSRGARRATFWSALRGARRRCTRRARRRRALCERAGGLPGEGEGASPPGLGVWGSCCMAGATPCRLRGTVRHRPSGGRSRGSPRIASAQGVTGVAVAAPYRVSVTGKNLPTIMASMPGTRRRRRACCRAPEDRLRFGHPASWGRYSTGEVSFAITRRCCSAGSLPFIMGPSPAAWMRRRSTPCCTKKRRTASTRRWLSAKL